MVRGLVSLSCVLAVCAGMALARPFDDDKDEEGIPPDAAGGTLQRGDSPDHLPGHARGHGGSGGNLIDHGGRILPASKIYYIWWGNLSAWPADALAGLPSLASGLNGSGFLNDIFPQYMRGQSASTSFVTSLYDSSTPPSRGPSTSTIVNEACSVIGKDGRPPDPTAVYVVLTPNFPKINYCAYHTFGTCNGQTIQVAYVPNTTGVSGCNPSLFACNQYSAGTQSIANVLSHEFSESITDANASAWYDSSGNEIGDKCNFQFQACVKLTTGNWQLQTEWSNAANGGRGACVQQ